MPAAMVYVRDVSASLAFYEAALGVERHHADADGSYGELHSGGTHVGFVAEWHARANLSRSIRQNDHAGDPAGVELYFIVTDVDAAYGRAVEAGGVGVVPPADKSWGTRAAIVRDLDGVLVEIATA